MSNGVPDHTVERTCAQMQKCKRFQELVKEMIDVSSAVCHAQTKAGKAVNKTSDEGCASKFGGEIIQEIESLIAPGAANGLDFEAVETATRRLILAFAARLVEQRLNADHSDCQGRTQPCECGKEADYSG